MLTVIVRFLWYIEITLVWVCVYFCIVLLINENYQSTFTRELTDLHKANAAKDSEVQEAALRREMKAKEEVSAALEKAQEEARQQQEALALQVGSAWLKLPFMYLCVFLQSKTVH